MPLILALPNCFYAGKGWLGWEDWLGVNRDINVSASTATRTYRSFELARDFARSLNLMSKTQWLLFCRGVDPKNRELPFDIPIKPWLVYKNTGWTNTADWLGIPDKKNKTKFPLKAA